MSRAMWARADMDVPRRRDELPCDGLPLLEPAGG
jgi:hypothetical protein